MVQTLINTKYLGRSKDEIAKGIPANNLHDYEYEPSLTDQTFNYSIASKVEDFIAAGQTIQAAAMIKNQVDFDVDHEIFSLYEQDLPVQQEKIREESERISKILEQENLSKKEKEEMEKYLEYLKKAGGVEGGGV